MIKIKFFVVAKRNIFQNKKINYLQPIRVVVLSVGDLCVGHGEELSVARLSVEHIVNLSICFIVEERLVHFRFHRVVVHVARLRSARVLGVLVHEHVHEGVLLLRLRAFDLLDVVDGGITFALFDERLVFRVELTFG